MEKDIGKITKNDTTDIVLRIDDFADKRGFTIREFVTSERYTGFTKAGVRILAKDWPKFKEMINSVDDEHMVDEPVEGPEPPGPPEEKSEDSSEESSEEETEEKSEEKEESSQDSEEEKKPSKEELPDY